MLTAPVPALWNTAAMLEGESWDIAIIPRVAPVVDLTDVPTGDYRAVVVPGDAAEHAQTAVGKLGLPPDLADDIAGLAESFLGYFGIGAANLRVEVVDRTSCPKFHCDTLNVRMITTYTGPTTQYIFRDNPDQIHDAPLGALVFLKGHTHPQFKDKVHHRSPPVSSGQKRLCVVLDY
jgi:hypothetical protein